MAELTAGVDVVGGGAGFFLSASQKSILSCEAIVAAVVVVLDEHAHVVQLEPFALAAIDQKGLGYHHRVEDKAAACLEVGGHLGEKGGGVGAVEIAKAIAHADRAIKGVVCLVGLHVGRDKARHAGLFALWRPVSLGLFGLCYVVCAGIDAGDIEADCSEWVR